MLVPVAAPSSGRRPAPAAFLTVWTMEEGGNALDGDDLDVNGENGTEVET